MITLISGPVDQADVDEQTKIICPSCYNDMDEDDLVELANYGLDMDLDYLITFSLDCSICTDPEYIDLTI